MALDLKNTPPRKTPAKAVSARPTKADARAEGLNGLFQLGSAVCLMLGQAPDAAACAKHGPNISREAANLAETNEKLGEILDYITSAGPYAGLITAIVPFGLQIMVNHGRLPAGPLANMGIEDPQTLKSQMEAEALRAHTAMLRAQADAEAELRAAVEELATQAPQGAESPNGAHAAAPEGVPL